jgi:F-type H+-transporting ATPase subunit epsilon
MTSLKTGAIRYEDADGKEHFVFVSGGFAEALPDRVTVLADSAERRKDIDEERAKAAQQRAEERLTAKASEDVDFIRARAALLRSIERLKIAESRRG